MGRFTPNVHIRPVISREGQNNDFHCSFTNISLLHTLTNTVQTSDLFTNSQTWYISR